VEKAILNKVPEIREVRAENVTPAGAADAKYDVCPVETEDEQGRPVISLAS
jgi:hypothetical protein